MPTRLQVLLAGCGVAAAAAGGTWLAMPARGIGPWSGVVLGVGLWLLLAAALARRLPRVAAWAALAGALVGAGLLNLTYAPVPFPLVDILHGMGAEWRELAWAEPLALRPFGFFSLLGALVLLFGVQAGRGGGAPWLARLLLVAALGGLGWLGNRIQPCILDMLQGPSHQAMSMPVYQQGRVEDRTWSRNFRGNAVPWRMVDELVESHRITGSVAHGMYARAQDQAVRAGTLDAEVARQQGELRARLWAAQEQVTAATWHLRFLVLPPLALWAAWCLVRRRPGAWPARLLSWPLAVLLYAPPLFNLAVHAALAAGGLSDGADRWHRSLPWNLALLATVLLADLAGRQLARVGSAQPRGTP